MASSFNITGDVSGMTRGLRGLEWTARAGFWADAVGPRLADRIKQEAPVGQGPNAGRLRDATRWQRRTMPGMVRLEFRAANVPYVPYVLKPTKPHDIVPRNARVLAWNSPDGPHFARRVHHPGTRGNNYPARAYQTMRPEIIAAFRRAFER